MGAAPGIAGSLRPEQEGCFLALDEWTADYFVEMNNTGGPVDVWAVDGIDGSRMLESPEGYSYFTAPAGSDRLNRRGPEPPEF